MSKGIPPGWIRFAEEWIRNTRDTLRIFRGVFRASGGGNYYRIFYKDKKGDWCSYPHPISQVLSEVIQTAEEIDRHGKV